MKIDKGNPEHWARLAVFAMIVVLAILVRPLYRLGHRGGGRIVFYGHKLAGNLEPIYRAVRAGALPGMEASFLTMDHAYHRQLLGAGETSILAGSVASIGWLATADAIVSDHGLHAMSPLLRWTDIRFFDVWHGIPYKGFDADDFRIQHRYDEVWVSSPMLRQMYIERFGFPAAIVHATGYARTDRLVRRGEDPIAIKRSLGLDASSSDKLVLFAPTWKQDARDRSLFPFGIDEQTFLGEISQLGERLGATFLMRAHLNSEAVTGHRFKRVVHLPYARYPDAEKILLVSDLLICDWSSIAFDYLLLDRPTIFLDVEPPFSKGFSLDASYRFGAVAADMGGLLQLLERYLADPAHYDQEFSITRGEVKARVYGENADGHATARCVGRLRKYLARAQPGR